MVTLHSESYIWAERNSRHAVVCGVYKPFSATWSESVFLAATISEAKQWDFITGQINFLILIQFWKQSKVQNQKARYVRKVLEVFISGRFSPVTELRVARWLTDGKNSREKLQALSELWERSKKENPWADVSSPRQTHCHTLDVRLCKAELLWKF